jgi:monoterpene epsilon-lactone hydrolase
MSLRNHLLVWAFRRWLKPLSLRDEDVATSRARTGRVPFGAMRTRGWRLREQGDAPFRGEWIEPERTDTADLSCILYFHGGGYIAMSPRTHRVITSRLAIWSRARCFALEYRLAPEHPFPAALDDALQAWRALIAEGIPSSRLVMAGDSAGGNLVLALLIVLRDSGEELPAAAVVFSPWTDLAMTGDSIISNERADPMFTGAMVARMARYYLSGGASAMDPLVSPLYADLRGLPPLLIQVGADEVLRDDSTRFAEQAVRAGVAVDLQIWPDVPHGWQMFAPVLPEAHAALRDASDFIRARLDDQSSTPYSARAASLVT